MDASYFAKLPIRIQLIYKKECFLTRWVTVSFTRKNVFLYMFTI